MIDKVQAYIWRHQLLQPQEKVLVALSGGADSVALLRVLLQLGYPCEAAHCNFHLRGEESDRDERFVTALCEQLQVPLHVAHFDTVQYAAEHKQSIEMAARDLRYTYFEKLLKELSIIRLAVAHHQMDQAETVLMNLLRGSGIHGLRGMQPLRDQVIRPLLTCSKEEILQYLEELQQDYVTDSTNLETDALRNKIRLQVLPLLQEINPQAVEAINRSATYLQEAESLLDTTVQQLLETYRIDTYIYRIVLTKDAHTLLLLHEWLAPFGFNTAQLEQVIEACERGSVNRQFHSNTHVLWIGREELTLTSEKDENLPPCLGKYFFLAGEVKIEKDAAMAFLDADRVAMPLSIVRPNAGDRFHPLGMKGSKLVSDFMTDRKFTPLQRQQQWVVKDAKGRIVWLIDQRIDDRFKVTESTLHVLQLKPLPCHSERSENLSPVVILSEAKNL